jgi:peroxisomal 3,2-trans-enoyl-CoA isomerase
MSESDILVSYAGKVATITLNVPSKLNALTGDLYYQLARAMNEVAARDDVVITVLTGRGRYFSAYVATSLSPLPFPPTQSISDDMVY